MESPKISPKNICVLSGHYPESSFESYPNHKAYCERHGYTYISCNWPTGAKNPYMNKIRYIKAYYNFFDYIFWIDDDAFFLDHEVKLEKYIPSEDNYISICSSPDFKNIFTFISSGQFLIRCDDIGRAFINKVEEIDLNNVEKWWTDELGYFSRGDQDAMVYLMHTEEQFKGFKRYYYKEFNSRIENLLKGEYVFLLHITGTKKKKAEAYLAAQNYLNLQPTLLNQSQETNLGVRRKNMKIKVNNDQTPKHKNKLFSKINKIFNVYFLKK